MGGRGGSQRPQLSRVEDGQAAERWSSSARTFGGASVVGLTWHEGAFTHITHRDPADRSGAVSRVTVTDGSVTKDRRLASWTIVGAQINGIDVGPDGRRMYVAVGPATSSASTSLPSSAGAPRHPCHCQDVVLAGGTFRPDYHPGQPQRLSDDGYAVPSGRRRSQDRPSGKRNAGCHLRLRPRQR